MGTLKQIKQTITYNVPNWDYCNLMNPVTGGVQATKCRFCVNSKKQGYTCVLYNTPLGTEDVNAVRKAPQCRQATNGSLVSITATTSAPTGNAHSVEPKKLIKLTIDTYNKEKQRLISQGYPAVIAESLAKDYLLGGN